MAQKKEHVQTHYLPTESYLATRAAALHFPAKQFADMINDQNSVYGMVIDMPINPVTLSTLVVYINGAANVYFNNGGSYTGASQRYQTVVQAGRLLVANASRILGECSQTTSFPLPTSQPHHQEGHFRKESPAICHQGRKRRHAGDLFPLSAGHAGTSFRTAERSGNVPEVNRNGGVSCDSIRKERTLYH